MIKVNGYYEYIMRIWLYDNGEEETVAIKDKEPRCSCGEIYCSHQKKIKTIVPAIVLESGINAGGYQYWIAICLPTRRYVLLTVFRVFNGFDRDEKTRMEKIIKDGITRTRKFKTVMMVEGKTSTKNKKTTWQIIVKRGEVNSFTNWLLEIFSKEEVSLLLKENNMLLNKY